MAKLDEVYLAMLENFLNEFDIWISRKDQFHHATILYICMEKIENRSG